MEKAKRGQWNGNRSSYIISMREKLESKINCPTQLICTHENISLNMKLVT